MDDRSSSCVKVLYSACDSVLSTKWLIQIGTEVLKWSRLSPNFVHVREALISALLPMLFLLLHSHLVHSI